MVEVNQQTYAKNTLLECDNLCESKLNLSNLVVRAKLRLEKLLSLSNRQLNEMVNGYLVQLIHLILRKHTCQADSNDLSLILIRNFFNQLQLNAESGGGGGASEGGSQMRLAVLLKKKLNAYLSVAHSCDSLVALNKLSGVQAVSSSRYSTKQANKNNFSIVEDDCLNEENFLASLDNIIIKNNGSTEPNESEDYKIEEEDLDMDEVINRDSSFTNENYNNMEFIQVNNGSGGQLNKFSYNVNGTNGEAAFLDDDDELEEEELFLLKHQQQQQMYSGGVVHTNAMADCEGKHII